MGGWTVSTETTERTTQTWTLIRIMRRDRQKIRVEVRVDWNYRAQSRFDVKAWMGGHGWVGGVTILPYDEVVKSLLYPTRVPSLTDDARVEGMEKVAAMLVDAVEEVL